MYKLIDWFYNLYYTNKTFHYGDKVKIKRTKNVSISANLPIYLRTDTTCIYISTMIFALVIIIFNIINRFLNLKWRQKLFCFVNNYRRKQTKNNIEKLFNLSKNSL